MSFNNDHSNSIGIFFGGNNDESGISIHSARSIYEILSCIYNVKLFFFNRDLSLYLIDPIYIFSNTIGDFSHSLNNPITLKDCNIDFAIPLIHGSFGEDGQLQKLLREQAIPFLFSQEDSCNNMYNKAKCLESMNSLGYKNHDSYVYDGNKITLENFINKHGTIIAKPIIGGSSLEIEIFDNVENAYNFLKNKINSYLVEEKIKGTEFSIGVIDGIPQNPIVFHYDNSKILSYHNKYFPSNDIKITVKLEDNDNDNIRTIAKNIYHSMNAKNILRIDGFIKNDGKITITDVNPIPGLSLNSFFFISAVGENYNVIMRMVNNAMESIGLPIKLLQPIQKINIPVLFGGNNSERQVSLLSGASVIIKLKNSLKYNGIPFFLYNDRVYNVPYKWIFKHSVEELYYEVEQYKLPSQSLKEFISSHDYIFLCLHGGYGEDGTIQQMLIDHNVKFNGENAKNSRLCMDKYGFKQAVAKLNLSTVITQDCIAYNMGDPLPNVNYPIIIKPRHDGCSTGVSMIKNSQELHDYILQYNEKSCTYTEQFIIESYVKTRDISIENINNTHVNYKGWFEFTVGYVFHNKKPIVLTPSLTLSNGNILTADDKFLMGTGINLTPPPKSIVNDEQLEIIKNTIYEIVTKLNFESYGRVDLFFNNEINRVIIIENNTLPALTFATVIYHQCLRANIHPVKFIEMIIEQSL